MLEYNNLSPLEFEYVCQDVMEKMLHCTLRRFAPGKDSGIDLADDLNSCGIIVQVKHYLNSPFSALKQALKAELPKIKRLNPKRYFVCCSQTLSPMQTKEIYDMFSDYMPSEKNIITLLELDAFLCDPANVEVLRRHFKLWLSSTNILSEIYNQDVFVDSETFLYDIQNELPYYVQTSSYQKSREILESERLLMIIGNPGVGKTTVSKMLILYFASIGYRVRYTTNGMISDIKRAISADPEQKEIILLDDCLGQCYFRLKDTQENELGALIKYVKYHPGKILLLNSRITIFNEAREYSPEFAQLFDRGMIRIRQINAEDIDPGEKALIFYSLLRKFRVPDSCYASVRKNKNYRKVVEHSNYNPRIIEYAAWRYRDAGKPEEFFDFLMDKIIHPRNVWKDEFERRMRQEDRYFMYTLYSLTNPKPFVEIHAMKNAYQKVLQAIGADISVNHFENVLLRLGKSLVRIVSREKKEVFKREPFFSLYVPDGSQMIGVLNPSVNDYLKEVFSDPALREFFKRNGYYVEQMVHMCDTGEEVDAEIRRWIMDDKLESIKTIDPDIAPSMILDFMVRFNLLDRKYEKYILPGLLHFPGHYYISSAFSLSHRKEEVIRALWEEPFFSFYHIREKANSPEGVTAFCRNLDFAGLIRVGKWLKRILVFDGVLQREEFIRILTEELEDAGQDYLDSRMVNYEGEETDGSFHSYYIQCEEDLYEQLIGLGIDEITYYDFMWTANEWYEETGGWNAVEMEEKMHWQRDEVDLILDRSIE